MSKHEALVVRIGTPRIHPNADALEILDVWGFQCVVRKGEWKPGDLAVYIEPDTIVPPTEAFAFLGDHRRIRVRKLRGHYSQGLLVGAPAGAKEGDDVFEALALEHYEPVTTSTDSVAGGPSWVPCYDVENWRKHRDVLVAGELVVVTEKVHGANARFVYEFETDTVWCGSRTNWKSRESMWGTILGDVPEIEAWCRAHPSVALFGEVFGNVGGFRYGGGLRFVGFDSFALSGAKWTDDHQSLPEGLRAPVLFTGAYDPATIAALAEGPSTIPRADHIREGCVVSAFEHRSGSSIRQMGAVKLKIVGDGYLEKS